jgi:hypothetical protein
MAALLKGSPRPSDHPVKDGDYLCISNVSISTYYESIY